MTESAKTVVHAVVALGLAAAAWAWAPAPAVPPVFDDQGEAFFPAFKDPVGTPENPTVQAMEVVEYDDDSATARVFQAKFQGGRWTIPSHYDYPADASERVGKTAAGVVGLRKDRIVSDRPADHASLGVVDPLDGATAALEGRGRRVTLRDASGGVLAEFIVGLPVEGHPDMRYIRLPDQKRVYAVKMDLDLSARFADWIETDLLKVGRGDLAEVVLDNYSVDEERGAIVPGDVVTLRRPETGSDWTADGLAEGEEVDGTRVDTLLSTLDELRIVGVRRKPEGLTRNLRAEGDGRLDRVSAADLQRKGYFLTRDGGLVSNEGEVRAMTKDGVAVTLRFGEVLFGDEDPAGENEPPPPEGEAGRKGVENRYLMVTADFDESALPLPEPPPDVEAKDPPAEGETTAPQPPGDDTPAEDETGDDPARGDDAAGDDAAKKEYERKLADRQAKVEAGQKKARELTNRFADWYYVISGDSFGKLHLSRKDLVKAKAEETRPGEPEAGPDEDPMPTEDGSGVDEGK